MALARLYADVLLVASCLNIYHSSEGEWTV